jgi:hypothetical protein
MAKLVWKRQDGRFDAQTSVQKWWAKGVLTIIKSRNPEIWKQNSGIHFIHHPNQWFFFRQFCDVAKLAMIHRKISPD